ncbi:MAG TPA: YdcF family protein [Rhodocyclaceae bacterium]|nr:YdcF family protein [Rhodocyclaceae bacterium]
MFLLKTAITAILLPPFSLILLAAFGLWLAGRHPRAGHFLIGLSLVVLAAVSTHVTSRLLMSGLVDTPPIIPEELARAQAIVVLGGNYYRGAIEYGGTTVSNDELQRLRYAARLARESGLPVAITGGSPMPGSESEAEVMRKALKEDLGVDTRWVETTSTDTIENASHLAPILKRDGIQRIALVTHVWHMRRARQLFAEQGFEVLPAPMGYNVTAPADTFGQFMPNANALMWSGVAVHEWLGLAYLRLRAELPPL